MWLRYYMDVHIPAAITESLRRRGVDVLTSQEDGTREVTDELLLQRAAELGRVLFSQDQDLLRIAHQRQSSHEAFPGLVFSPQRGASVGRLIDELELIAKCARRDEAANQVIYLPLS